MMYRDHKHQKNGKKNTAGYICIFQNILIVVMISKVGYIINHTTNYNLG